MATLEIPMTNGMVAVYELDLSGSGGREPPIEPEDFRELRMKHNLPNEVDRFSSAERISALMQVKKDLSIRDLNKVPWSLVTKQLWYNHYADICDRLENKPGYMA